MTRAPRASGSACHVSTPTATTLLEIVFQPTLAGVQQLDARQQQIGALLQQFPVVLGVDGVDRHRRRRHRHCRQRRNAHFDDAVVKICRRGKAAVVVIVDALVVVVAVVIMIQALTSLRRNVRRCRRCCFLRLMTIIEAVQVIRRTRSAAHHFKVNVVVDIVAAVFDIEILDGVVFVILDISDGLVIDANSK